MTSRGGNTDRTLAMGGSGGTTRPSMAPQAPGGVVKARQLVSYIPGNIPARPLYYLFIYRVSLLFISTVQISFEFPMPWAEWRRREWGCRYDLATDRS